MEDLPWWDTIRFLTDVGGIAFGIGIPLLVVGYILYWFFTGKDPD